MIVNDDSLVYLKKVENNSFDCCITDPPYSAAFVGILYNRLKKYQEKVSLKKNRPCNIWNYLGIPGYWTDYFYKSNEEYESFTRAWMAEIARIIKPGSFLFMFGCFKLINVYVNIAKQQGFKLKDMIIWKYKPTFSKGYSIHRLTKDKNDKIYKSVLSNSYEVILVFQSKYEGSILENYNKNKVGFLDTKVLSSNVIECSKPSKKEKKGNPHYSIKPESLMELLVKGSVSKSVIDPFMGTGVLAVVCKKLGVEYLGIELEKEFFDFAKNRLDLDIPNKT